MGDTLVLDYACFPLGRVSWRRALALLRKNKAVVLDYYEDWTVKTVTLEIMVPSVIKLINKILGRQKAVKFSRQNIYVRDNGRCQYCATKVPLAEMTLDHVTPRSLGGKTTWENTVVACQPCNQKKSNKSLEQSKMKLLSVPIKPKKLGDTIRFTFMWTKNMPESWKTWLQSYTYWNTELEEG